MDKNYLMKETGMTGLQWYQLVIRQWQGVLPPRQFQVLVNLVDRTAGWQKTRVKLSISRLLHGDAQYSGISISRATLFDALHGLEKRGIILRTDDPNGSQLKEFWINFQALAAVSRGDLNQSGTQTAQSENWTGTSDNWTHNKETRKRVKTKEDHSAKASLRAGCDHLLDQASPEDGLGRQAAPARKPSHEQPDTAELARRAQQAWRRAVLDCYPSDPATTWSVKTVAMVKGKARGFNKSRELKFDQFVGWCAENWALVCSKHLNWMNREKPPLTPDIGFLIAFWDHFLRAWSEQDFKAWMTAPDRTRHEQLVAKGMTAEEAAAQIGEERAVIKMREENRKAAQRVNIKVQEAQRMERRAEKLGGMPAHPHSQVARRVRLGGAAVGLTLEAPIPTAWPPLPEQPTSQSWCSRSYLSGQCSKGT